MKNENIWNKGTRNILLNQQFMQQLKIEKTVNNINIAALEIFAT
jgi:hypothetical protein